MAQQDTVQPGDVTQRVGVEVIRARGVDVDKLIKMLVANAAAEFASTYYYYTILRMNLAGHEDYKEICEDARLEDRAHGRRGFLEVLGDVGGGRHRALLRPGDARVERAVDIT